MPPYASLIIGHLLDAILAFMVVEGLVLLVLHRRTGRGIPPRLLVPNLVSGAGLLVALRGALTDAGGHWIFAGLAIALIAHLADLRARLVRV